MSQVVPDTPCGQVHVNVPAPLLQVPGPHAVPVAHSLTSAQVTPLPAYPDGHAPQENEPAVLAQATGGDAEQPPLLVAHSLTSLQVNPLPLKPTLQLQELEPAVLVHVAPVGAQPPLATAHSLTSLQVTRSPV